MSELISKLPHSDWPDISKPRWDQSSYFGRAKHFFTTANPLNLFCNNNYLEHSKEIVTNYRKGVVKPSLTIDELWRAKQVYDSAFHPDTGQKMILIGRMSAQVPCNMLITTGLLTCYQKKPGLIFFHWINQTFNAIVNYTNRSGDNSATNQQLFYAYFGATGGALSTAIIFNRLVKKFPPLIGRFVPFIAIAVSNLVNISMMRFKEFQCGTDIKDEKDNKIASSRRVAACAILQVVASRVGMAIPVMVFVPIVIHHMMKKPWYRSRPWINIVSQISQCCFLLTFATPLCCAIFAQKASIHVKYLEKDIRKRCYEYPGSPSIVYYNKGL